MRVLVAHQRRRSRWPSGENAVVDAEVGVLREHGHEVELFEEHSDDLVDIPSKAAAAIGAPWNPIAAKALARAIDRFDPDVVHFHNIMPSITPAAVAAAGRARCAVVMTLHSFWLFCAAGTLSRDGVVCEDCLGRSPLPALRFGCYRGARLPTLPLVAMQLLQRALHTVHHAVDCFVAPSSIVRDKAIAGGLSGDRVVVKPHFVSDAEPLPADAREGCIFVGRLSEEKGVRPLLEAWRQLPDVPLRIVGDGPLRAWCQNHPAVRQGLITLVGLQPPARCRELIARSRLLVFPSICYETFGLSIAEAFACATPVVATGDGAARDHVEPGHNGLLCDAGDVDGLVAALRRALAQPAELDAMGRNARATYEARYSREAGYVLLRAVYDRAVERALT